MRECDRELLRVIQESHNPEKALKVALELVQRCVAGEEMESIADSYGLSLEEVLQR